MTANMLDTWVAEAEVNEGRARRIPTRAGHHKTRERPRECDQRAAETYGALREGVHIAGFSFERALHKLEWLLEKDRWRQIGYSFDDVNRFLDSIQLDNFRVVVEQRKKLVKLIKQLQPAASNRQIAKTLGVVEGTIRNDTAQNYAPAAKNAGKINGGKTPAAQNYAPAEETPSNFNEEKASSGPNAPPTAGNPAPPGLDGAEAAQLSMPLQIVLKLLTQLTDEECRAVKRALEYRHLKPTENGQLHTTIG
jgi:hypothetical protein